MIEAVDRQAGGIQMGVVMEELKVLCRSEMKF